MQKHLGLLIGVASALAMAAACGGTTATPGNSGTSGTSGTSGGTSGTAAAGTTDDAGTCTTDPCDPATADAGTGTDFGTPTVCTSGTTWTRGNRGSTSMHPGVACIDCHDSTGAPSFSIAGTVYPSAHEPDDCNGTGGTGTTVVVTDKNGKVYNIPVNAVGNFYSVAAIATPFKAKVVKGGKESVMVTGQTVGDCNTCHSVTGTMAAPGRIVAP